jgi:hypothetical protein
MAMPERSTGEVGQAPRVGRILDHTSLHHELLGEVAEGLLVRVEVSDPTPLSAIRWVTQCCRCCVSGCCVDMLCVAVLSGACPFATASIGSSPCRLNPWRRSTEQFVRLISSGISIAPPAHTPTQIPDRLGGGALGEWRVYHTIRNQARWGCCVNPDIVINHGPCKRPHSIYYRSIYLDRGFRDFTVKR